MRRTPEAAGAVPGRVRSGLQRSDAARRGPPKFSPTSCSLLLVPSTAQTSPSPARGPQALSQQAQQQGAGFGRPGQSFYSNRAMTRGAPKLPRRPQRLPGPRQRVQRCANPPPPPAPPPASSQGVPENPR
ncbi:hypothetical protein ANANG_G00201950 [Anguilla anguilla]|uniref:Cytoplasmic activation/proliferation-associated protein-1 C term domain-containing protein n=1 Tax=Anguilla anguilla TaxID=7936 RepID=A0A9D3RR47_ANGAN|nr:hypothetical protein ANANG_G00201950 [Anguilla anguilla]